MVDAAFVEELDVTHAEMDAEYVEALDATPVELALDAAAEALVATPVQEEEVLALAVPLEADP